MNLKKMYKYAGLFLGTVYQLCNIAMCANNNISLNDIESCVIHCVTFCGYDDINNNIVANFNQLNNITQNERNIYPTLNTWILNNRQVPDNTLINTVSHWLQQGLDDMNVLMQNNGLFNQRNKDIAQTICFIVEVIVNRVKPLLCNPLYPHKLSKSAQNFLLDLCSAVKYNHLEQLNAVQISLQRISQVLQQNNNKTVAQINNH